MRHSCAGADLRAVRHPHCRPRAREGGHLLLLRALRRARRRHRAARPRRRRRVNVLLVLANFFRSSPRKRGPMITALWSWAPARARSARLAETTAERDADRVGAAVNLISAHPRESGDPGARPPALGPRFRGDERVTGSLHA